MAVMETVARELGLLLRSVKGLHHAAVSEAGVRVELSALSVLTVLADRGTARPSAVAEALHLDLSSVSRQVAALERDGWVSRSRDPDDSRAALLELTDTGWDVLRRVRAGRVAQLSRLLPGWSDEDLADFAVQLHRFRTDLTGSDAPDAPDPQAPGTTRTTTDGTRTDGTTHRTPALAGQES